ncbi:MAG: ABC transporter ATP-binding protein [bacterium]|nr:ABC transporter ATP-binding protein [bacterium]
MIKINNLTVEFKNLVLFKDKSISFKKNNINIITGLNGIGKTTILKILANLVKTNANIENLDEKIFYLPQIIQYPKNITLKEYLSSIFFSNWKWSLQKADKEKIQEILEKFELTEKQDVDISKLSSGELQKANIALGLLSNAKVLLLDEPTSNMDIINKLKILENIKKLKEENVTAIITMHDINLAAHYGDYFIGITPQKEIICSEKEQFFTETTLQQIYGINFKVTDDENFHIQIFN